MNMSDDVIGEILSWLPVKSLIRFKSVCKDWDFLIQSDRFVANHIKNQSTNEKLMINHAKPTTRPNNIVSICSEEEDGDDEDGTRTLFHEANSQQYYINDMPLHDDLECDNKDVQIIGTCNGLVCLDCLYFHGVRQTAYDRFITLWNPATRDFKTLPQFQLPRPPTGFERAADYVGFGFDCATNDYKVIRISQLKRKNQQEERINQMMIYCLSTNCWKEFDCSGLSTIIIDPGITCRSTEIDVGNMIFGNQKLYSLATDTRSSSLGHLILSFDMGKEFLQTSPLPSEYTQLGEHSFYAELFPWHESHDSIALILLDFKRTEKIFEIWASKELEQGRSSWIKIVSIDRPHQIEIPLGFWKCRNRDKLFICYDYQNFDIVAINCNNSRKEKKIFIKVNNDIFVPCRILTYVETLVSLNRS